MRHLFLFFFSFLFYSSHQLAQIYVNANASGDNSTVPAGLTTDFDSNAPIQFSTVDMGAFEDDTLPPPTNDDCDDFSNLLIASDQMSCSPITGTTILASQDYNLDCNGIIGNNVWYNLSPVGTYANGVTIEITNFVGTGGIGAALYFFLGQTCAEANTEGAFSLLTCDYELVGNSLIISTNSSITIDNNFKYRVAVWSASGNTGGDFDICAYETPLVVPVNDECVDATSLILYPDQASCSALPAQFGLATASLGNPSCDIVGRDVWFEFNNPSPLDNGVIIACSAEHIALYNSCGGLELGCTTNGNLIITDRLLSGDYKIRVWEDAIGTPGSFDICVYPVSCEDVSNLATANIGSSFVDLDWQENSYATVWELEYGIAPLTQGNGIVVNIASHPYTLSGLSPNSTYDWYVRSGCGSAWVQGASFTTDDVVGSDECAQAPLVAVNSPGSNCLIPNIADNTNATDSAVNNGTPCGFSAYQGADVWFQFTAPSTGIVLLQPTTNEWGSYGTAIYDGCNSNSYIDCGSSYNMNGLKFTNLAPGQTYYLRMWDEYNNTQGILAFCLEELIPPVNDNCSTATFVAVATSTSTCTLSTADNTNASDSSPINGIPQCNSYQGGDVWYEFIAPASGGINVLQSSGDWSIFSGAVYTDCNATTEIGCSEVNGPFPMTFTGLTVDQQYFLRLWDSSDNQFGPVEFCIAGIPANDLCANAVSLNVNSFNSCPGVAVIGTTIGATDDGSISCGSSINMGVWYDFMAPANGDVNLQMSLPNGGFYPKVTVFDACGGNEVFCTSQPWDTDITSLQSGQSYYILVSSSLNYPVGFMLCLEEIPLPPVNDLCNTLLAFELIVGANETCNNLTATNVGATDSGVFNPGCASYSSGDVWFSLTIPASGSVTIETSYVNGFTNGGLAVYSGSNCSNLSLLQCDDNSGLGFFSKIILEGETPGGTLFVRVWEYGNDAFGDFNICAYEPIINNDCSNAFNIDMNYCENGDIAIASNSMIPFTGNECGNYGGTDLWYSAIVPATGGIVAIASGNVENVGIAIYAGTCGGGLTQVGDCVTSNGFESAKLQASGFTENDILYIRIWGDGGTTGVFNLCVEPYCEPIQATIEVNPSPWDCSNDEFRLGITVTDFGTGTGTSMQVTLYPDIAATIGPVDVMLNEFNLFGPFAAAENVFVEIKDPNSGACSFFGQETGCVDPPSNDNVCSAIDITASINDLTNPTPVLVPFSNAYATSEIGEMAPQYSSSCTASNAWCDGPNVKPDNTIWYQFDAPANGQISITLTSPPGPRLGNTQLAVWEVQNCDNVLNGTAIMVAANDDFSGSTTDSKLELECLIPGVTYYVQIDGKFGDDVAGDIYLTNDSAVNCGVFDDPAALNCSAAIGENPNLAGLGEWQHFYYDDNGTPRIIASINDQLNDLGQVNVEFQISNLQGALRVQNNIAYLDRNWRITVENQPLCVVPVLLRLYITDAELQALSLNDPNLLILTKVSDTGGMCDDFPTNPANLIEPPTENIISYDNTHCLQFEINSFSEFFFSGSSLLPVEWGHFELKQQGEDKVLLSWSTLQEANNKGFHVERSSNGKTWVNIGWVDGIGWSEQRQNYSFLDQSLEDGQYYYRLIQEDEDATKNDSPIRSIRLGDKQTWTVQPNPFEGQLSIHFDAIQEATQIRFYDLNGQLVREIKEPFVSDDFYKMDLSDLATGVYFLEIQNTSESQVTRIVKF